MFAEITASNQSVGLVKWLLTGDRLHGLRNLQTDLFKEN